MADDAANIGGQSGAVTASPHDDDKAAPDERDGALPDDALDGAGPDGCKPRRLTGTALAFVVGLVAIAALGTVSGWLGLSAYRLQQAKDLSDQYLDAARQCAVNLTTINYSDADDAVKRILDSSTGTVHQDFQQRSQPFVDTVRQTQSTTEGTVTAAALESVQQNEAQVLVAVAVRTSSRGQPAQQPRMWRIRMTLQRDGVDTKMSQVTFVP